MAHCYHLPAAADAAAGDVVVLEGAEAQHAAVARLRAGERVLLTSGDGRLAEAQVLQSERRRTELRIDAVRDVSAHSPRLTLVQALAKGERAEIAIASATELGVDRIVPWQAERSIVQWRGDRAEKGVAKWSAAALEASKQAIRAHVPEVLPVIDTDAVAGLAPTLIILDPQGDTAIHDVPVDRDIAIVVGPEGGISPAELEAFAADGALRVRLGREVLRTSTAGLAAIAALSPRLGRWVDSGP